MSASSGINLVDGRPRPRDLSEIEKVIQAAVAARFSALGYYVVTNLELPLRYSQVADVAGIRPILKELKNRNVIGPAPTGVLCWLDHERWTSTETVIAATGSHQDFIRGVLIESEGKGWVEKRVAAEDVVHWRLKDYHYPTREAFIVCCGSTFPLETFHYLTRAGECCNLLYLILDYDVDPEFIYIELTTGMVEYHCTHLKYAYFDDVDLNKR